MAYFLLDELTLFGNLKRKTTFLVLFFFEGIIPVLFAAKPPFLGK